MTKHHRPRAGFTLTELAIVLGVVGLVLSGIWTAAGVVYDSRKAEQAVQQITTMVGNMRALYGTRGSFTQTTTTDMTAAMISANVVPNDLLGQVVNGNRPTNAWNGGVAIWAMNASTMRISFYNTPPKACLQIASSLIGNAVNAAMPIAFTANASVGAGATIALTGSTPSSQTLSTMCAANNGSSTASTEFDYTIR